MSVAIARAVDFLAAEDGADWSIELGRSFGARRWGIARFDGAVARYDQLEPTDQTRVWRRMIEPDTRVTVDNLAGLHEEDYMTGRALHCDRIALPADYGAELKRARSRGGYWHTHAAMAIGILREIGCPLPITSHEATRTIEGLARVRDQERFLTDLALEAEAFLYWLGRRDLTDPRFVDRLRAAQHDDGSWGDPADDTRWHGTVLALFILQFATEASPGTEPWCAGARPATASAQASAPSSGR